MIKTAKTVFSSTAEELEFKQDIFWYNFFVTRQSTAMCFELG